ncbi:MAG TPA: FAD-dependent oxidoreductase [Streptosporangiaceae bacterium]|nr:FAD-dependent oxidoreductase [Streptosporangiaceae bacterium]
MPDANVAIVGAGPYGLAAAAHLHRAGVEATVFGDPMSFWRGMPEGMLLRSNWTATAIADQRGPLTLDAYCTATGSRFGKPVPLSRFVEYGTWVQRQVVPDVDHRMVAKVRANGSGFHLTLADGGELRARRVVVAAGIAPFAVWPDFATALPSGLVSHTGEHDNLARFAGSSVLVVGGGQSALESAALLHELGASPEVAVRAGHVNWLHGGKYQRLLGRLSPLVYAPTDVGPMGLSRLVAVPGLFTRLPRQAQDRLAYRAIRPAGAAWLADRLRDVPIRTSAPVAAASATAPPQGGVRVTFADGSERSADHLLLGTGYRVEIARYPFLPSELTSRIRQVSGYPVLRRGFESSVPRLHFLGAPAAYSYGPVMRFVSGGWFSGRELARAVKGAERA